VVITLLRNQPELRMTLIGPKRPLSEIRLIITTPPYPPDGQLSLIIRKGWWGYPEPGEGRLVYPEDPAGWPALVYPAFEFDDEGAVVFRLDRRLWARPCGRYTGRVVAGGDLAAAVDIDLQPVRWTGLAVEVGP
jgi:hypothetical protein